MSRLIDQPGAQRTVVCTVDRSVLVELLDTAAGAAFVASEHSRMCRIADLRDEVESGERGSLTVGEWREMGGGE